MPLEQRSHRFDARTMGELEAARATKRIADRFNRDVHTAIGDAGVATTAPTVERATGRLLGEYTGFRFYSLGPAYVTLAIPFDIVAEFRNTTQVECTRKVVRLQRHILFPQLEEWGTVLEGMPAAEFAVFCQYMETQTAMDKQTGTLWHFRRRDLVIPDPVSVDERRLSGETAAVSVFLPSGEKYRLDAAPDAVTATIRMVRCRPAADVLHAARMLKRAVLPG